MDNTYLYKRKIDHIETYDVIVVGSGSAGSTAAIAAASEGARTLLIEKMPFLGGTSTAVLDTFYGFYTPGKQAIKIVGGLADSVVAGLKKFNACLERPNSFGAGMGITYHPEYLKVVWENLVKDANCHVLLNAWVQDVVLEEGRISGLIVATKSGVTLYRCRYVIDSSGDADVCFFAGIPFELAGAMEPAQTLTTTFKMVNVDVEKRRSVPKQTIQMLMKQAAETGNYDLPRKEGSDHITPVDFMTATIMTRLRSYDVVNGKTINATDPWLLSKAEMDGRLQAIEYVRFLKDYVPGYEKAALATFSCQIGVRETRRIYGEYRLSSDDVLSAKQFKDQIGLCGAPMEDHCDGDETKWKYLPDSKYVGIPYRTLVPKDTQNILVAGRCFSADHSAHSSVRSMAQCMAMGEAAGTAMALACRSNVSASDVDIEELQAALQRKGVKIA